MKSRWNHGAVRCGFSAFALWAMLGYPLHATSADIYISETAQGEPAYASEKLDSSYRLFMFGEKGAQQAAKPGRIRPLDKDRSAKREAVLPLIRDVSYQFDVDADLVEAVVEIESGFNSSAVSPRGAVGLMQLMPATAAGYKRRDWKHPRANLEVGVRYLKDLLRQHQGNIPLALAAYNAGKGAVRKHGARIPPYRETMLYVPAVLARFEQIKTTK